MESTIKSPCQVANDEFFDAEDEVDSVKEDDADDFLKKLEAAIESPPSKRQCLEDNIPIPSSKASGNGETKIDESKLNGSVPVVSTTNPYDSDKTSLNESVTDIDEKLENDLLKDLDDDHIEDLDSVSEEVKNLVDSVLEDDVSSKELTLVPDIIADLNSKNHSTDSEKKENRPDKDDEVENNEIEKNPIEVENENSVDSVTKFTSQDETPSEAPETKIDGLVEEDPKSSDVSPKADDKENEQKNDDLLVACASPKGLPSDDRENSSETSSSAGDSAGDTPEDSDFEKQNTVNSNSNDDKSDQTEVDSKENTDPKAQEEDKDESMDVEVEEPSVGELVAPLAEKKKDAPVNSDENGSSSVLETESKSFEPELSPATPKEFVPFKMPFVRQFSTAVGKLSRVELEQLLIEKITESLMFCSENTDLRSRLEKQEKISEAHRKRLDNVKKQYNDLEMIHNRVMKDLKDRPEAPITPVKITRAVGLQVYQPQQRSKFTMPLLAPHSSGKSAKRQIESEPVVNGNGFSSPESKKKKTLKTTPLRPPLSDIQKKTLELEEAKVEQNLRKNVINSISPVIIPASVTMTPVINGGSNSRKTFASQSIDLTDDTDETSSGKVQQPPALVAIRANQAQQNQRQAYVVHPALVSSNNKAFQQRVTENRVILRTHPAPLPQTPVQISKPGMKKFPPRPTIKINNVQNGIIVSWSVEGLNLDHSEIHSYQIYAYEVTCNEPTSENWRHVGDVKALLLPMAVTLTQFQEGQKYFFAVRAMDIHKRLGQFSLPKTWIDK